MLWGRAIRPSGGTEEALDATRSAVTVGGHNVPVSEKGDLELLRTLADKVQKLQHQLDANTRQLSAQGAEIGELELKIRRFMNDSAVVSDLKKQLADRHVRIAVLV